ncbi:hypothetical protein P3342_007318 [Pyrenophora teres f. teres]|nr:hypothetical protein P3342_007318 [Pyrenophora teres f. teres]
MSNDDHVLSTVMHHIISDGWSLDVLMRELAAFYSASMRGQDPLSGAASVCAVSRLFCVAERTGPGRRASEAAQLLGRAAAVKPASRVALRQAPTGSTVWRGWRTVY